MSLRIQARNVLRDSGVCTGQHYDGQSTVISCIATITSLHIVQICGYECHDMRTTWKASMLPATAPMYTSPGNVNCKEWGRCHEARRVWPNMILSSKSIYKSHDEKRERFWDDVDKSSLIERRHLSDHLLAQRTSRSRSL